MWWPCVLVCCRSQRRKRDLSSSLARLERPRRGSVSTRADEVPSSPASRVHLDLRVVRLRPDVVIASARSNAFSGSAWPGVRPVIRVSDFDNGAAGERTELASWVADRHHCEGLNILRYPEHGLYFVLAPNMVRSDGSA